VTGVPKHLRPGLERWVRAGILPGGFLRAVLEDNLPAAQVRADSVSLAALPALLTWRNDVAPPECWGSPQAVRAWHERGGYEGRR
jgi:hypothetical protein